jgi:hypothetical protein
VSRDLVDDLSCCMEDAGLAAEEPHHGRLLRQQVRRGVSIVSRGMAAIFLQPVSIVASCLSFLLGGL